MTQHASIADLEARLAHLTTRTLSAPARYAHVALLLASVCMGVLLASLLATEPALPGRTRIAMSTMLAIAFAWTAYAGWVLTRRRPLMARHRVVAGWMAVTFTGMFVLGTGVLAVTSRGPGPLAACATGVMLFAVAVVLLVRARRAVERLSTMCSELAG